MQKRLGIFDSVYQRFFVVNSIESLHRRQVFRLTAIVLTLLFITSFVVQPASGIIPFNRYVATTGSDTGDCKDLTAPCLTVAYAVAQSSGGDTIHIAAGTYKPVNISTNKSLVFQGVGMDATILDGEATGSVFYFSGGVSSTIIDLTIEDGSNSSLGGGITSTDSNLTLTRVKISTNQGYFGGGLNFKSGNLVLSNCLITNNSANENAGAIYLWGTGSTSITGTTISNNQAKNSGAFFVEQSGGLSISNTTIVGNSCTNTTACHGAIYDTTTPIVITNSTISENQSNADSAVFVNGGTITFKNSIVALNYAGASINDCRAPSGSFVSQGYNLRSDVECGSAATDIYSTSPMLNPLQDNGGFTLTKAPLPGSPVINAGPATDCSATDQRGFSRPRGSACDIGAVEFQPIGSFSKTSPVSDTTGLSKSPSLSWETSAGATNYWYCYDNLDDDECTWIDNGASTSVSLTNLVPGATYYWHVKAERDTEYSNGSGTAFWSFTVMPAPGGFNKFSPGNGLLNRPPNLTLKWGTSSGAVKYEYCLKKSGGTCAWTSTGLATSKALSGLIPAKYLWQVRAKNIGGTTFANGGTWWSFTVPPAPGTFNKTGPATGSINKPTTLTLYWGVSSNADSYQYCIKKKMTDACIWKSTGVIRNVTLTGLSKGTKYYWQVRAKNATGTVLANAGTWWNFSTAP